MNQRSFAVVVSQAASIIENLDDRNQLVESLRKHRRQAPPGLALVSLGKQPLPITGA
jgi:hypothetical protein